MVDAEFEEITDEDAPKNTTALAVREQNTPVKNNAQEDNLNDIKIILTQQWTILKKFKGASSCSTESNGRTVYTWCGSR